MNRTENSQSPISDQSSARPSSDDDPTIVASRLTRESKTRSTHEPRTLMELQFSTRWWLRYYDATTPEFASKLLCSGKIAPFVLPNLTIPIYSDIQDWVKEHGYPTRE